MLLFNSLPEKKSDNNFWTYIQTIITSSKNHTYLWNTSRTTNQDNVINLRLVHLCVTKSFLHWLHRISEQIGIKLFEASASYRRIKVNSFEETVDFDTIKCMIVNRPNKVLPCLSGTRQSTFSALTSGTQATECTGIRGQVLLVLTLEFLLKMVDHAVVEIFAAQMLKIRYNLLYI